MKRARKALIWLGGAACLLLAAGWALDRSGYLVRALKPQIVEALSKATGRAVEVKGVDGGLFGAVVLREVTLGPKPGEAGSLGQASLEIAKATVSFSLWDYLVLRKPPMECLRRLDLESPLMKMGPPEAAPAQPRPPLSQLLKKLPLPPISTRIDSGELLSHEGKVLLSRLDASFSANLRKRQADFILSAKVLEGSVRLKGHWKPESGSGQVEAQLDKLLLSHLDEAGLLGGLPRFEQGWLKGRLSAELGGPRPSLKGLLKAEGLRPAGMAAQLPRFDGEIEFEGSQARIRKLSGLAFGGKVEGEGSVADLADPELKLTLRTSDPAFSLLAGASKRVEAELALSSRGLNLARLQAWSGGAACLEASGWMGKQGPLWLSGDLSSFPAQDALLSGRFELGGSAGRITGSAQLGAPSWTAFPGGRLQDLAAQLHVDGGQWRLSLDAAWLPVKGLRLEAQGALKEGAVEARQLTLKHGGETWIRGRASKGAGARGALKGWAEMDLAEVAPLVGASGLPLAGLRGPLKAQLGLAGEASSPQIKLSLDGKGLSASAGAAEKSTGTAAAGDGFPFPIDAKLDFSEGRWKLGSLRVRGGELSAKGDLSAPGRLEAGLKAAQAPAFAAALGLPSQAGRGRLEGGLELELKPRDWKLSAGLKAKDLLLSGFLASDASLEAELGPHSWQVRRLAAAQATGGTLSFSGGFDPQGRGTAEMELEAKEWKYRGRAFSFKAGAEGSRPGRMASWFSRTRPAGEEPGEIGGDLLLEDFSVDAKALPLLKGHWSWHTRGELQVKEFSFGPGLGGKAEWRRGQGPGAVSRWRLEAEARQADMRALATLLGLEKGGPKGPFSAKATAEGSGGEGRLAVGMGEALQGALEWGGPGRRGRLELKEMDLSKFLELASWSGEESLSEYAKKWSGKLTGLADYEAGRALPLSFSAKAAELRQSGRPWVSAQAEGAAGKGELWLSRLELGPANSRLSLRSFSFKADRLSGDFEAQDFPEGAFMRMSGAGQFKAQLGKDQGEAEVHWKQLRLNRHELGAGGLLARSVSQDQGRWEVKDLQGRWEASLLAPPGQAIELEKAQLRLPDGAALEALRGLDEEGKPRLELSARGLDFAAIAGLLDWKLALGGQVWGNGVLRLPSKDNPSTKLMVSAKVENGHLAGFPFDLATGSVRLQDGRLDLKPMGEPLRVMRRGRYDGEISGVVPLEQGDQPEEMAVLGRFSGANLGMLDYLDSIDAASGTVNAEVRIKGTPRYPEFSGKAEILGGQVRFAKLIAPASDLQARLFLDQNRLQVLRMDMQVGSQGQRAYFEAAPGEEAAVVFDQWIPSKFNLRISSGKAGIPLQATPIHEFIGGNALIDLLLGGDWDNPSLQGRIGLLDGNVTWPIRRSGKQAPVNPHDFSERMLWDLEARALGKVNFLGGDALRAEVRTDDKGLRISGPGSDLSLEGRIKSVRGRVSFFSADFNLSENEAEESSIEFRRDLPPYINLWGVKEQLGNQAAVKINAFGPLGKIDVRFPDERDLELNAAGSEEAARRKAALIGLGSENADEALGAVIGRSLVWLGSRWFKGARKFDLTVRAPALARNPGLDPGTATARANYSVDVGTYLPGSPVYVKVGAEGKEKSTEGRAGLVMPVSEKWNLEGEVKVDSEEGSSGKAMLKTGQSLESYNPKKRREELERKRAAARATPSPTPSPSVPEN